MKTYITFPALPQGHWVFEYDDYAIYLRDGADKPTTKLSRAWLTDLKLWANQMLGF